MNKKITPLGDRILVKPSTDSDVLEHGIVRAESTLGETKSYGEVIEIGEVTDIKKGDNVVFAMYTGDEIEMNNEKYFIVSSKDIIAKLA